MNKLEIGMYVRTDKTGIKKIYKIDNNKTKYKYLYKLKNQDDDGCIDLGILSDNNIIKASHNIIDLIEVGDIISYEYPTGLGMIGYENVTILPELLNTLQNGENNHEYKIKSIVTHEQFSAMEYRLGDK